MLKREAVDKILRYWQKRLLMQDWEMDLYINENNVDHGNAQAEIGAREASITIDAAYSGDVSDLVCHEVLHMVLEPLDTFSQQWSSLLPFEVRQVFTAQWDDQIEHLVDQLQKGMCDKTTTIRRSR